LFSGAGSGDRSRNFRSFSRGKERKSVDPVRRGVRSRRGCDAGTSQAAIEARLGVAAGDVAEEAAGGERHPAERRWLRVR
jgi:hypothetical protein